MGVISISPLPGEAIVSSVTNFATALIDRLFPNPVERDKAKLAVLEMQQKGDLAVLAAESQIAQGQLDINKVEAAHSSIFVAGWRPFIGWICGLALAGQFIAHPIVLWYMAYNKLNVSIPAFDFTALMTIVLSMLGVGAMRSYEKTKGVA